MPSAKTLGLALAGLLVAFAALAFATRAHWIPEHSPAERGSVLAGEHGCWSCHESGLFEGSRSPERIAARIVEVPEHPEGLPERAVADLTAWIALVQYEADRAAARGPVRGLVASERLARRQCFSCHGDLGQGGVANPGSLKGYVPGFFGRDYDVLTRNDDPEVVREWIREGVPRFFHQGIGRLRPALWFTERQRVQMPGFGRSLTSAQVEGLVRYLTVLRQAGPLDGPGMVEYRKRLGLPISD